MNNDTEEKPNETDQSEQPPLDDENGEPADLTEELLYLFPLFDQTSNNILESSDDEILTI